MSKENKKQSKYENQDKNTLAEARTDLADERTVYAKTRTFQAAERTYSAWVRTGFPIASAGVTLGSILRDRSGATVGSIIGGTLIVLGILTFLYAWIEYKVTYNYLRNTLSDSEESDHPSRLNFITVSIITSVLLAASVLGFFFAFF